MQTHITNFFKSNKAILSKHNPLDCLSPDLKSVACAEDKIIFKHDFVVCCRDGHGALGIYATGPIEEGTLLCMEEAIIGSTNYVATVLSHRLDIAEELYPRANFDFHDKVCHNTWEYEDEAYAPFSLEKKHALCPYISKFNHHCSPNASVETVCISKHFYDNPEEASDNYVGGIVVYAVQDIEEGEEIYVNYGWDIGHTNSNSTFNWKCNCGLNKKTRSGIVNRNWRFVNECYERDCDTLIDQYVTEHYGL